MNTDNQSAYYGRITSFSLRGKRLGDKFEKVMAEHGDFYTVKFDPGFAAATIRAGSRMSFPELFGRNAPVIVEIGPGSGEQLISAAQNNPDVNYLAFEAWAPGVARCVNAAVRAGVKNVRIAELDAAQAIPEVFGSELSKGELDSSVEAQYAQEVWTFFPDPWRKKRHRKRRIVSPSFAQIVASILQPGGVWRMATDWDNYAWQMRDVIAQSPWFDNPYAGQNIDPADEGLSAGGFAPRFAQRIMTRFEQRGIEAGRSIHDITAVRNTLPITAAIVPEDPWIAASLQGIEVIAARGGERPPSSRRGLAKNG